MKGIALAFLALSTAVGAQTTPRDKYRELCKPPKYGKAFDDGYEISYTCDSAGDSQDLIDSTTKESPDACALHCKSISACQASDWFYGSTICNTYSSEHVGDDVPGSVLIRPVTPESEDETPAEDASDCEDLKKKCDKDLQTCSALKDDLQDDLDACLKGRKSDKESCDDKVSLLEDKLAQCSKDLGVCKKTVCPVDPVWERRKEAMKICGYGGRKTITAGAYTYRAHCQRQAAVGKFYKQLAVGVDECLAQCSKDKQCKAVNYVIMDHSHCKMYTTGGKEALTPTNDAECTKTSMIGFTRV